MTRAIHLPLPRPRPAGAALRLIAALLGLLIGASAWMTWGALQGLAAAKLGDEVALPGGALVVEAVIPEQMAPMNHAGYANLGMSMSAVVPDMTPEGLKTFAVMLTLSGRGAGGMSLDVGQFRVSGPGLEPTAPLRSDMAAEHLPQGSLLNGSLVFRVPADVQEVSLSYAGGRPVLLSLGEAPDHHEE